MKKIFTLILSALLMTNSLNATTAIGLAGLTPKLDTRNAEITRLQALAPSPKNTELKNAQTLAKITDINNEIAELSKEFRRMMVALNNDATPTNYSAAEFDVYFGGTNGVTHTNEFEALVENSVNLFYFILAPNNNLNDAQRSEAKYVDLGKLDSLMNGLVKVKSNPLYTNYSQVAGVIPSANYAVYKTNLVQNRLDINALAAVLPVQADDIYVKKSDTNGLNRRGLEVSYNLKLDQATSLTPGLNGAVGVQAPAIVNSGIIGATIGLSDGLTSDYEVVGSQLGTILGDNTVLSQIDNGAGFLSVDASRYAVPSVSAKTQAVQAVATSTGSFPVETGAFQKSCEVGYSYDDVSEKCVASIVANTNCSTGFVYDASLGLCTKEVSVTQPRTKTDSYYTCQKYDPVSGKVLITDAVTNDVPSAPAKTCNPEQMETFGAGTVTDIGHARCVQPKDDNFEFGEVLNQARVDAFNDSFCQFKTVYKNQVVPSSKLEDFAQFIVDGEGQPIIPANSVLKVGGEYAVIVLGGGDATETKNTVTGKYDITANATQSFVVNYKGYNSFKALKNNQQSIPGVANKLATFGDLVDENRIFSNRAQVEIAAANIFGTLGVDPTVVEAYISSHLSFSKVVFQDVIKYDGNPIQLFNNNGNPWNFRILLIDVNTYKKQIANLASNITIPFHDFQASSSAPGAQCFEGFTLNNSVTPSRCERSFAKCAADEAPNLDQATCSKVSLCVAPLVFNNATARCEDSTFSISYPVVQTIKLGLWYSDTTTSPVTAGWANVGGDSYGDKCFLGALRYKDETGSSVDQESINVGEVVPSKAESNPVAMIDGGSTGFLPEMLPTNLSCKVKETGVYGCPKIGAVLVGSSSSADSICKENAPSISPTNLSDFTYNPDTRMWVYSKNVDYCQGTTLDDNGVFKCVMGVNEPYKFITDKKYPFNIEVADSVCSNSFVGGKIDKKCVVNVIQTYASISGSPMTLVGGQCSGDLSRTFFVEESRECPTNKYQISASSVCNQYMAKEFYSFVSDSASDKSITNPGTLPGKISQGLKFDDTAAKIEIDPIIYTKADFAWMLSQKFRTAVLVNLKTKKAVGEYYVSPQVTSTGIPVSAPVKSFVDEEGSLLVSNADGSLTKIENNMLTGKCYDRNLNGRIETSVGSGDRRTWSANAATATSTTKTLSATGVNTITLSTATKTSSTTTLTPSAATETLNPTLTVIPVSDVTTTLTDGGIKTITLDRHKRQVYKQLETTKFLNKTVTTLPLALPTTSYTPSTVTTPQDRKVDIVAGTFFGKGSVLQEGSTYLFETYDNRARGITTIITIVANSTNKTLTQAYRLNSDIKTTNSNIRLELVGDNATVNNATAFYPGTVLNEPMYLDQTSGNTTTNAVHFTAIPYTITQADGVLYPVKQYKLSEQLTVVTGSVAIGKLPADTYLGKGTVVPANVQLYSYDSPKSTFVGTTAKTTTTSFTLDKAYYLAVATSFDSEFKYYGTPTFITTTDAMYQGTTMSQNLRVDNVSGSSTTGFSSVYKGDVLSSVKYPVYDTEIDDDFTYKTNAPTVLTAGTYIGIGSTIPQSMLAHKQNSNGTMSGTNEDISLLPQPLQENYYLKNDTNVKVDFEYYDIKTAIPANTAMYSAGAPSLTENITMDKSATTTVGSSDYTKNTALDTTTSIWYSPNVAFNISADFKYKESNVNSILPAATYIGARTVLTQDVVLCETPDTSATGICANHVASTTPLDKNYYVKADTTITVPAFTYYSQKTTLADTVAMYPGTPLSEDLTVDQTSGSTSDFPQSFTAGTPLPDGSVYYAEKPFVLTIPFSYYATPTSLPFGTFIGAGTVLTQPLDLCPTQDLMAPECVNITPTTPPSGLTQGYYLQNTTQITQPFTYYTAPVYLTSGTVLGAGTILTQPLDLCPTQDLMAPECTTVATTTYPAGLPHDFYVQNTVAISNNFVYTNTASTITAGTYIGAGSTLSQTLVLNTNPNLGVATKTTLYAGDKLATNYYVQNDTAITATFKYFDKYTVLPRLTMLGKDTALSQDIILNPASDLSSASVLMHKGDVLSAPMYVQADTQLVDDFVYFGTGTAILPAGTALGAGTLLKQDLVLTSVLNGASPITVKSGTVLPSTMYVQSDTILTADFTYVSSVAIDPVGDECIVAMNTTDNTSTTLKTVAGIIGAKSDQVYTCSATSTSQLHINNTKRGTSWVTFSAGLKPEKVTTAMPAATACLDSIYTNNTSNDVLVLKTGGTAVTAMNVPTVIGNTVVWGTVSGTLASASDGMVKVKDYVYFSKTNQRVKESAAPYNIESSGFTVSTYYAGYKMIAGHNTRDEIVISNGTNTYIMSTVAVGAIPAGGMILELKNEVSAAFSAVSAEFKADGTLIVSDKADKMHVFKWDTTNNKYVRTSTINPGIIDVLKDAQSGEYEALITPENVNLDPLTDNTQKFVLSAISANIMNVLDVDYFKKKVIFSIKAGQTLADLDLPENVYREIDIKKPINNLDGKYFKVKIRLASNINATPYPSVSDIKFDFNLVSESHDVDSTVIKICPFGKNFNSGTGLCDSVGSNVCIQGVYSKSLDKCEGASVIVKPLCKNGETKSENGKCSVTKLLEYPVACPNYTASGFGVSMFDPIKFSCSLPYLSRCLYDGSTDEKSISVLATTDDGINFCKKVGTENKTFPAQCPTFSTEAPDHSCARTADLSGEKICSSELVASPSECPASYQYLGDNLGGGACYYKGAPSGYVFRIIGGQAFYTKSSVATQGCLSKVIRAGDEPTDYIGKYVNNVLECESQPVMPNISMSMNATDGIKKAFKFDSHTTPGVMDVSSATYKFSKGLDAFILDKMIGQFSVSGVSYSTNPIIDQVYRTGYANQVVKFEINNNNVGQCSESTQEYCDNMKFTDYTGLQGSKARNDGTGYRHSNMWGLFINPTGAHQIVHDMCPPILNPTAPVAPAIPNVDNVSAYQVRYARGEPTWIIPLSEWDGYSDAQRTMYEPLSGVQNAEGIKVWPKSIVDPSQHPCWESYKTQTFFDDLVSTLVTMNYVCPTVDATPMTLTGPQSSTKFRPELKLIRKSQMESYCTHKKSIDGCTNLINVPMCTDAGVGYNTQCAITLPSALNGCTAEYAFKVAPVTASLLDPTKSILRCKDDYEMVDARFIGKYGSKYATAAYANKCVKIEKKRAIENIDLFCKVIPTELERYYTPFGDDSHSPYDLDFKSINLTSVSGTPGDSFNDVKNPNRVFVDGSSTQLQMYEPNVAINKFDTVGMKGTYVHAEMDKKNIYKGLKNSTSLTNLSLAPDNKYYQKNLFNTHYQDVVSENLNALDNGKITAYISDAQRNTIVSKLGREKCDYKYKLVEMPKCPAADETSLMVLNGELMCASKIIKSCDQTLFATTPSGCIKNIEACPSTIIQDGVLYNQALGEIQDAVDATSGQRVCSLVKESCFDLNGNTNRVEKTCPSGFTYSATNNNCSINVNTATAQMMGSTRELALADENVCRELSPLEYSYANSIGKDTRWKRPISSCERTVYRGEINSNILHVKYLLSENIGTNKDMSAVGSVEGSDNVFAGSDFVQVDSKANFSAGATTLSVGSTELFDYKTTIGGVDYIAVPVIVVPKFDTTKTGAQVSTFALSGLELPARIYSNGTLIYSNDGGTVIPSVWSSELVTKRVATDKQYIKGINDTDTALMSKSLTNVAGINDIQILTYLWPSTTLVNSKLSYFCDSAYCGIIDTKESVKEDLSGALYANGVDITKYDWDFIQATVLNGCAGAEQVFVMNGSNNYCYSKDTDSVIAVSVLSTTANTKSNSIAGAGTVLSTPVNYSHGLKYQEPCSLVDGYQVVQKSAVFKGVTATDNSNLISYHSCQKSIPVQATVGPIVLDQPIQTQVSTSGVKTILEKEFAQETNGVCYSIIVKPKQTVMRENTAQSLGEKINGFKIDASARETMVNGATMLTSSSIGNVLNEKPYYCYNMKDEGSISIGAYFYNDYFTLFGATPEFAEATIKYGATGVSSVVDMASITKIKPNFIEDIIVRPLGATPPSVAGAADGAQSILGHTLSFADAGANEICVLFKDNLGGDLAARSSSAARLLTVSVKGCDATVQGSTQIDPVNPTNGCFVLGTCPINYTFNINNGLCEKLISYTPSVESVFVKIPVMGEVVDALGNIKYSHSNIEMKSFFLGKSSHVDDATTINSVQNIFAAYFTASNAGSMANITVEKKLECRDGTLVAVGAQCSHTVSLKPQCPLSMLPTSSSNLDIAMTIAKRALNDGSIAMDQFICKFFPAADYGTILAVMPQIKTESR